MCKNETITRSELYHFLCQTDQFFPVPISQKQDLESYAKKLCERADIIAYREKGQLSGVIAGYITRSVDEMAYVSFISVLPEKQGRGIGTQLIKSFIKMSRIQNKKAVHLYAVQENSRAMAMYKKLGFIEYKVSNELRPTDIHLIMRLD